MVTKVSKGVVDEASVGNLPAGAMAMYGGAAAPSGWLLCDGAAVSRTTYSALFTAIGTAFGTGDGSTTFNVPNFKGRSPLGVGQGNTAEGGGLGTNRALAATVGTEGHTLAAGEMPTHAHDLSNHTHTTPAHSHGITGDRISTGGTSPAFTDAAGTPESGSTNNDGSGTSGAPSNNNSGNAGSGQSHNNMHPALAVNFIIKT